MLDFDSVLQRLNDRGVAINELEARFKTSLKNALLNFTSAAEAKSIIERADKEFFISRRTEFVDLGNNRGNSPINYWKKECRLPRYL